MVETSSDLNSLGSAIERGSGSIGRPSPRELGRVRTNSECDGETEGWGKRCGVAAMDAMPSTSIRAMGVVKA